MGKRILISGASSGFGALTAGLLAEAGHVVFAGMRDSGGRNAVAAAEARKSAESAAGELHVVDLDVTSDASVQAAVESVGRIDVLIHNAGRLAGGPTEAFTPEQLVEIFETNVVGRSG